MPDVTNRYMTSSKDGEDARRDVAKKVVLGVLDCALYDNVPYRLAVDWGINSSHLSKLLKEDHLTPSIDDLLVEKGLLPKKPPKDPRSREWMRTDDVVMATGKLLEHYDVGRIAAGLKAGLDPTQLQNLIQYLQDN